MLGRHNAPPSSIPFENLELGQLLGQGSFGRVYRGRFHGSTVAVKVPTATENRLPRQHHGKQTPQMLVIALCVAMLTRTCTRHCDAIPVATVNGTVHADLFLHIGGGQQDAEAEAVA